MAGLSDNNEFKTPIQSLIKDYHISAAKHHLPKIGYSTSQLFINHFIYMMHDAELQFGAYTKGLMDGETLEARYKFQINQYNLACEPAKIIGAAAYILTMNVNLQEQK